MAALREASDDFTEGMLYKRIEAVGRLVEQQQSGIVLHGDDQPDLLSCSMREEFHTPPESAAVQRERVDERIAQDGRRSPAEAGEEIQDGKDSHIAVEPQVAGEKADVIAGGCNRRALAEDKRIPAARTHQPQNDAQRRRFPCSVRTQVTEHFASFDAEADTLQRNDGSELLLQVTKFERLVGRHGSPV